MAKRFIDTGLFDDPWFMELSKDGKLFWIYLITKCNHAGIIERNEKLFKFHIGISDMDKVIKELSSRLVTVNGKYFFIPKYLFYQYPNFPNSKVKAQQSAIEILDKLHIDLNSYQTLSEDLPKDYGNVNDTGNENGNENGNEDVKAQKSQVIYPFKSDHFMKYWNLWKEYKKKEFGFTYKSTISEQAALKKLTEMAGAENDAIAIIEQSMAGGWKGFFNIKQNTNGKSFNQQANSYFAKHDPNYKNY